MTVTRTDLVAALVDGDRTVDPALLDEIAWTRPPVGRRAQGYRLAIRTTSAPLDTHLDRVLGDLEPLPADELAHPGTDLLSVVEYEVEGDAAWAVFSGPERVFRRQSLQWLTGLLMWWCNRNVIASTSGPRLTLHAGAAARDGRAVVMAAPQESGKTTLTTGLLRRGYDYLTDEAAAFDRDTLELSSYAKPLSIDEGSWPLFPELAPPPAAEPYLVNQWLVPAHTVGSGSVVHHATPVLLVSPRYASGGETAIHPTSPSQMVRLLAESTFGFPDHAVDDLRAIARLVERCAYAQLEVADLAEACDIIDRLLEEAP